MIILSANKQDLTMSENMLRTQHLFNILNKQYVVLAKNIGSYLNEQEMSFTVDSNDINSLLEIAKLFNQESILHVNADNIATLHFTTGNSLILGTFEETDDVSGHDGWTHDLDNNRLFIITKLGE
jgi:hypothetical protein